MATENQACSSFANAFGRYLAQSISHACGKDWAIRLPEPQPETTEAFTSGVYYRLRFSSGLEGGCLVSFEQADLAGLTGKTAKRGKGEELISALLEVLGSAAMLLEEELMASHGLVQLKAEAATAPEQEAPLAFEFRASNDAGRSARIALHFEEALIASFAALAAKQSAARADERESDAGSDTSGEASKNLDLVMDVELEVTLRFGQRQLTLREILDLASGAVVELDRQVEEPVELILDGKVIARGEAVIIDGNYGMRVTQVVQPVLC